MKLRLAFMGTPDFAVPSLDELVAAGHEVAAVYTQPPRPAGRGHRLQPSPVQRRAEALGIPVRTPRTLREKVAQIAEFSELGDFLNMPLRYYSAGMLVRLAFSIATAIDPEVLLIDEVLAAGDLTFQQKAIRRLRELMGHARAIVLVSHDLPILAKMCDRLLWLDHGKVHQIGEVDKTLAAYEKHMSSLLPKAA